MSDFLRFHGPQHPGLLVSTISWSSLKFLSIGSVMLSSHLILCRPLLLLLLQSFPASGSFPMSQLFASGGQSIGASASATVHPMNIQGWLPLGLTGLISLLFKGLSRVFSSTTIGKHQFFGTQPSLWSNSHIYTQLLEKPQLWLYGPLLIKWSLCFLIHCLSLSYYVTFQGASIFSFHVCDRGDCNKSFPGQRFSHCSTLTSVLPTPFSGFRKFPMRALHSLM